MNEIQLVITKRAYKILENRPSRRSFFLKILKMILKSLEKYFGSEILVKIPSELYSAGNGLLNAIDVGHKLQSLGVIKNITKRQGCSDEPFLCHYYTSSINRAYGSGVDFFNEEKAVWRSLAEATERYLWQNLGQFPQKTVKASYKKIRSRALNIFSLAGFSENQKSEFPLLRFDENTDFNWTAAYSLTAEKKIFCPIQLVSAYYFKQKTEPMLRWCITTGLATGPSLEEAITKGILEVIERDAFMIAYLNKLSPPIVDLEYLSGQNEEIAKIIKNFKRYNLEVYILQLPTDFPVYINLAIIVDRSGLGPALSVGAKADFDFKTAFLGAISESLIVRHSLKNRFNSEINLKKIGREERLIYWGKIENLPKIEFFLKGEKIKVDLDKNFYKINEDEENKNLKKYYQEKLKFLKNDLKKKNYETCYVELTTKEIKKIGFRCVQTVIPELQPMHLDESIPYFGGKRLKEIPLKFGYQPAEVLNQEPHPFP